MKCDFCGIGFTGRADTVEILVYEGGKEPRKFVFCSPRCAKKWIDKYEEGKCE